MKTLGPKSKVQGGVLARNLVSQQIRSMSGIALEKEALKLSAEEKVRMIDVLWRSLDPIEQSAIDRAWLAESRDRLEAFRKGELKALDGEAAIAAIKSELRR